MSSSEGAGPTLRVEELSVARAGNTVVRDVSLEIPPGEVTALLGANGAGKSTLVLAIAGVIRATAGRILLGEQDLTRSRPEQIRAAGVAVVPEGRRMLHDLSVEDNLRVATYALSREDARSGVTYALDLFPRLEDRRRALSRSLSGGEQQMLVLAQALVSRPKVLVVDELARGEAACPERRGRILHSEVGRIGHRAIISRLARATGARGRAPAGGSRSPWNVDSVPIDRVDSPGFDGTRLRYVKQFGLERPSSADLAGRGRVERSSRELTAQSCHVQAGGQRRM